MSFDGYASFFPFDSSRSFLFRSLLAKADHFFSPFTSFPLSTLQRPID